MAHSASAFDPAAMLERIRALFDAAPFVKRLGMRVEGVEEGRVESVLTVEPWHLQQDGVVHAGVIATVADHTAGGAALTRAPEGHRVLSIEFKVNLLRLARGHTLRCRAEVLKAGRSISVTESSVWALSDDGEQLVSKATVTLALVEPERTKPKQQG